VEVHLDVLSQMPVDTDVRLVDAIGPEVGIGEPGGEDLVADIEVGEAEERLQGPRSVPAIPPAEDDGIVRLDDAHAASRLSREQVAGLDVEASDRNLGLVAVADRIALVSALPLADQGQTLIEVGHVQVPE